MKIPYSCFDVYFLRGVSDTKKIANQGLEYPRAGHCMAIMGMRSVTPEKIETNRNI